MVAFFLSRSRITPCPSPTPTPITGSRERKAGWHLFLIGCFKSLFSPGQSGEEGKCPARAGGGGRLLGFPFVCPENVQVGALVV